MVVISNHVAELALIQQLDQDFARARWRARYTALISWCRRRSSDLLSLAEVRSHIAIRGQHDRGLRMVRLDQIVGSEGRTADFDRHFMPRTDRVEQRWKLVDRAYAQGLSLSPIDLSQLGSIYFVRDGHHRISVARLHGQQELEAHCLELQTDVPLTPELEQTDLVRKRAQNMFLAWSDLLRVRPGAVIPVEASEPTTYRNLQRHIEGHRTCMEFARGIPISLAEAVVHWYDYLYLPQVTAIRQSGIVQTFGHRTETCIYLATMEYRYYLSEQAGEDPGPEVAVRDYVRRFGPRHMRRKMRQRGEGVE